MEAHDPTAAEATQPDARAAPGARAPAANGKAGAPTDALVAFGESLVSAAKTASSSTADPNVALAFSLGWQMAELYRPGSSPRPAARTSASDDKPQLDDLPGLSSLDDPKRAEILVDQVQAALARLAGPLAGAGFGVIDLSGLRTPGTLPPPDAVLTVHVEILGHLTAADFRLGKAYGLGRALADTCRKPTDDASLRRQLGNYRVANLLGWLDDLNSAFPPHAGHAVAASLRDWSEWAARDAPGATPAGQPSLTDQDALKLVRRQGELWRALLSGEKRGADMLDMDAWLDVAKGFERRLRTAAVAAICRMRWLAGLILFLFAFGVALMIFASDSGVIVAGAATLLSSVGLTWRGIGGSLGQLAGKLEQPLFGSATDDAVAASITLLPKDATSASAKRSRLALELPFTGRGADVPPNAH
jgi:hypothetical protein